MTFQAKLRLDFNIKVFWNVILSNVSHGIIFIWQKLKEIGSMEPQFWLVDFLWSTTMNHLASLTFSWLLGLMEDHICVRWCNMKYPLKYLINCWRNLLKKSHKIPRWIRVSKANQLQTLDDFLIKITCEDHGDPYMMLRANVNQLLIVLLALRVSNPRYELDGA